MSDSYKIYASKDYVDEKTNKLSEEIANAVPSTDQAHMQLVTDKEGMAKWEDRPYYRTTERMHVNEFSGENLYPYTVTTMVEADVASADCPMIRPPEGTIVEKFEVWFDGKQYMCEPKFDSGDMYFGATLSEDGPINFDEYPFVLFSGFILTADSGEHVLDVYAYITRTVSNYGNTLVLSTTYKDDDTECLTMEDITAIQKAWNNNIPILIKTNIYKYTATTMRVTEVTEHFIYASTAVNDTNNMIALGTKMFLCSDGSLHRESAFYGGSVFENENTYPVLNIRNVEYKIDVNSSGNLTATKLT